MSRPPRRSIREHLHFGGACAVESDDGAANDRKAEVNSFTAHLMSIRLSLEVSIMNHFRRGPFTKCENRHSRDRDLPWSRWRVNCASLTRDIFLAARIILTDPFID
jgi:hypothetical protein